MREWLPLAEVAVRDADPARLVAWRGGDSIGHARFRLDAGRWQAAFLQHPGARIALYFDDAYQFSAALFGAWHAGKEVVLPGDAQPATLERLSSVADGFAGDLPGSLQPAEVPQCADEPLDPEQTRAVIFTSGSSGQPLAIAKHLRQLDAEIAHLEGAFGSRLPPDAAVHATVSHQHIYGLLFVILWPLAAGRAIAVERLVYPEQMAERLTLPSVLVSSPAHLKRLPDHLDWQAARAGVHAIFSSGGPLPPESAQLALDLLGHSPTEVYGSSETGGIAWRQRALHGDTWTPLPGVEWRLQGETLGVRSGHLADGEWWETSDRARAEGDNGFILLGRADRIVKVEEKRVSLVQLEQALMATGLVAEARGLMVQEPAGARLGVVAVLTPAGVARVRQSGRRTLAQSLRESLSTTLERVALPRRFRFVRELPFNPQGKTTDAMLQALFAPVLPPAQWRHRTDRAASAVLSVTPELRVFDGHFPGTPLLPGVAQVDWAAEFGRQCFALPPAFVRAEQLKFQLPVSPPQALELELEWQPENGRLSFWFRSGQGLHSSGRLVFGGPDV